MGDNEVQEGSRTWWGNYPMAYDWRGDIEYPQFTKEWFAAIDARFIAGVRLFATDKSPFDRIMPLSELRGRRVLEIGCGMGLHTETLVRAGAQVTAIDITDTAISATRKRLGLSQLGATLRQADAESLPFQSGSFDFVWSWGVIHHSARTARIVREISRVLSPEGSCRVMVYNRQGMAARIIFLRDFLMKGGFLHHSFDEVLFRNTDGFSARYYVRDQFIDLFRAFFGEVRCEVLGQDADALPLPRVLRRMVLPLFTESYLRQAQARRGAFLFLEARCPN
jgi:SAM-dependent methyltransferase